MKKNKLSKKCLICKKEIVVKSTHYPFCSLKCSQVDLGRWLNESYTFSQKIDEEKY